MPECLPEAVRRIRFNYFALDLEHLVALMGTSDGRQGAKVSGIDVHEIFYPLVHVRWQDDVPERSGPALVGDHPREEVFQVSTNRFTHLVRRWHGGCVMSAILDCCNDRGEWEVTVDKDKLDFSRADLDRVLPRWCDCLGP